MVEGFKILDSSWEILRIIDNLLLTLIKMNVRKVWEKGNESGVSRKGKHYMEEKNCKWICRDTANKEFDVEAEAMKKK